MYPFDLQRALAGEELITRDGKKVHSFGLNHPDETIYVYEAMIDSAERDGSTYAISCTKGGTYWSSGSEHRADLFMKYEKKQINRIPFDVSKLNNPKYKTVFANFDYEIVDVYVSTADVKYPVLVIAKNGRDQQLVMNYPLDGAGNHAAEITLIMEYEGELKTYTKWLVLRKDGTMRACASESEVRDYQNKCPTDIIRIDAITWSATV